MKLRPVMAGRAFAFASLLAVLPAAQALLSACSSSTTGDDQAFGGPDGSVQPDSGSSSGSGGTTDSGSSSGSSGGSGSSSGVADAAGDVASGSSSGAADAGLADSGSSGGHVPTNVQYSDAGVTICGTVPCDLKSNICCVDLSGNGSCLANTKSCPAFTVTFACVQQTDCPSGQVCCVVATSSGGASAKSQCQDVSTTGGKCTPADSSQAGSAQMCQTDAECKTGSCLWQDCSINLSGQTLKPSLTMCGLQNNPPFTCKAH
jgi:hypothetical protein